MEKLTLGRKNDIDQIKKNMKQKLPVLTPVGIRRYRLPYHECVILELKESGMVSVAEYIEKLFQMDEEENKEKSLKFQRNFVDYLKKNLVEAELAQRKNQILKEMKIFLDTALFFQSLTSRWLWIVDELLKKTLIVAEKICDDGFAVNTIKYFYGKFIFQCYKNFEEALSYLNDTKDASKEKNWNVSKFLKGSQNNLYKECNILLYDVHEIMARKCRAMNPKLAVEICLEALSCANDSEDNEYISKALYELGKSQMMVGHVTKALKIFAKFLAKVKRIPDPTGICNGYKQLAIVHHQLKDHIGTLQHLRLFRQSAEAFGLSDKLAEAHYSTGKYLLECKSPSEAFTHLKIAFDTFKELEMTDDMNRSRYLLGISQGEKMLEKYMKLILNCGNGDKHAISKLFEWKDRQTSFSE